MTLNGQVKSFYRLSLTILTTKWNRVLIFSNFVMALARLHSHSTAVVLITAALLRLFARPTI